ncbi:MAG TPA: ATP-dependent 6-phosphofructokinase [Chloroflexota bacterium]|nr:ATP-dependent 6-phosphofructokinase [Chloroflexota bacterium]
MRIGVLTGGGDCPGLNAAIRAVVRRADQYGYEVLGILNGWAGLLGEGRVQPLGVRDVSGILPLGGTILGTSRTNPFRDPAQVQQVLDNLRRYNVDALIAIGGDDTLGVAAKLYERDVQVVGIPKTMDNDVNGTDYTIGFNSAVTIVADALDKLHTTASSHHRVLVVEVMGREAGWVAVVGGLAGGADFILIPERPTEIDVVCRHLERRRQMGKDFSIIVVAEGAVVPDLQTNEQSETDQFGHVRLDRRNIGELLGREIERRTGFETRVTVLGHLQRGGSPTLFDRVLATRYGVAAVDYVNEGRFGYMPALRGTDIVPCPLAEAVARTRLVDLSLYELAQLFY